MWIKRTAFVSECALPSLSPSSSCPNRNMQTATFLNVFTVLGLCFSGFFLFFLFLFFLLSSIISLDGSWSSTIQTDMNTSLSLNLSENEKIALTERSGDNGVIQLYIQFVDGTS